MFVLGDLCCDETVRLFEYLHGVYCRKKGEIHLDTLAVASAWSLSLHCLQRHQEAAELQAGVALRPGLADRIPSKGRALN